MENLTFALGVLTPHEPLPLEGHTVVVLEPLGVAGEEVLAVLAPGDRPPKSWFRWFGRRRQRFAFAVSDRPALRAFTTVGLSTQVHLHGFAADILIHFRVIDPLRVVARRADDPVRQILHEAERLSAAQLANMDALQLREAPRGAESFIGDLIMLRLRAYAETYGLWISDVAFAIRTGRQELVVSDRAADVAASALDASRKSIRTAAELTDAIALLRKEIDLVRSHNSSDRSLLGPPGNVDEAPADKRVAFRALWPSVLPRRGGTMTVYASLGREGALAVAHDIADAMRVAPALSGAATTGRVTNGARIRVTPYSAGLHFEPASVLLPELTSWLRTTFAMRPALAVNPDEPIRGTIEFSVGPLVVGQIAFSVTVQDSVAAEDVQVRDAEAEPHRKIFVSYSRRDAAIVTLLERAYKALGDSCLRDVDVLRSGEDWRRSLLRKIDEADIFQLCWSRTARASRYVEEEWRHALSRDREHFIRPLYWQRPLPPPPHELAHLHFAYYEMPRKPRYTRRSHP